MLSEVQHAYRFGIRFGIVATCTQNRSNLDRVVAADHACNLAKRVIVAQGNEVNPVHHDARIQLLATCERRTVIVGSFASSGFRPTGFATLCVVFTVFRQEGVVATCLSSSCTQKTHHECWKVSPLGATAAAQVSGKSFPQPTRKIRTTKTSNGLKTRFSLLASQTNCSC